MQHIATGTLFALTLGRCAADPAPAGAAESRWNAVLATGQHTVSALAVLPDQRALWVRATPSIAELVRGGEDAPEVLDSASRAQPDWGGASVIAVTGSAAFWSPPARDVLRWVDLESGAVGGKAAVVTDLDSAGELVVTTDHNAGKVAWTTPAALRAGEPPFATASVEYASGVATDGDRTWVIQRLSALLLVFEQPGGPSAVAASWPGDNTMDLHRGPTDLVWWNHATGEVLALGLARGSTLRTLTERPPGGSGALSVDSTSVFGVATSFDEPYPASAWRVPLVGGDMTPLGGLGEGCTPPLAATSDGGVVVGDCGGEVRYLR